MIAVIVVVAVAISSVVFGFITGRRYERNTFFRHPSLACMTLEKTGALRKVGLMCERCDQYVTEQQCKTLACLKMPPKLSRVYAPSS